MTANCPICDAQVSIPADAKVSEVIRCVDCNNQLVIEKIDGDMTVLQEAPQVEEDWGE